MAVGINLKNVGDRMSGFKDVVGHKNIIQYIGNAVTSDTVSHAYILNGERGSGKKLLANLFAMSLQCQNREADGDACGKCQSCKQAMNGNQPDIIRVVHEKPTTISVDDIREQVNNDIVIKPYSSKYKIYIIDDENKVFSIAFRTTPKNSTGVPHILEHSVLCGSREFPLKDPWLHFQDPCEYGPEPSQLYRFCEDLFRSF